VRPLAQCARVLPLATPVTKCGHALTLAISEPNIATKYDHERLSANQQRPHAMDVLKIKISREGVNLGIPNDSKFLSSLFALADRCNGPFGQANEID
jgi:hypothetical protein